MWARLLILVPPLSIAHATLMVALEEMGLSTRVAYYVATPIALAVAQAVWWRWLRVPPKWRHKA